MRLLILILPLFLFGCTATLLQHTPNPVESKVLATQIIEQVVAEQPLKYRPEGMLITDEYLAFGDGTISKGRGVASSTLISNTSAISIGVTKTKSKHVTSTLYFNSLDGMELFHKRDWYIIQLRNDENNIVKRFYTRSRKKADRFIDAMNFYISTAKDFGV